MQVDKNSWIFIDQGLGRESGVKYLRWTMFIFFIVLVLDRVFFGNDSWNIRFCVYFLSWVGFYGYRDMRRRGELTEEGIRSRSSAKTVRYEDINEIAVASSSLSLFEAREADIYISDDSPASEMKVSLNNKELVRLAKSQLNHWVIDGDGIRIKPGAGESRTIRFEYLGRHYTTRHFKVFFYVLFPLIWINEKAELVPFSFIALLVLLLLGNELLKRYDRITVALVDDGVWMKDGQGQERYLPYDDVDKVEKGFIHTKLTAKNGEAIYFPRAWDLLPELLEDFAGLRFGLKDK